MSGKFIFESKNFPDIIHSTVRQKENHVTGVPEREDKSGRVDVISREIFRLAHCRFQRIIRHHPIAAILFRVVERFVALGNQLFGGDQI